jgi:hypothetical protein
MKKKLKSIKKVENYLKELVRLKKSPKSIAFGFALGTFLALLPTFSFAPVIGLALVFIFKDLNKISLFASFIIWNIFLLTPIYYLSYKLGSLILDGSSAVKLDFTFNTIFNTLSKRFLLGNIIIAITVTLISYVLVKFIANRIYLKTHGVPYHKLDK